MNQNDDEGGIARSSMQHSEAMPKLGLSICATSQIVSCLHRMDDGSNREFLHAFFLDQTNRLCWSETMAIGSAEAVHIEYRSLICTALRVNAAGIILGHNHPSGAAVPSEQDISATRELQGLCKKIGIEVIDHVVVAANACFSFRAEGIL